MTEQNNKFSLTADFYLDAPEDWDETETGEFVLTDSQLILPGNLTLTLKDIKSVEYQFIKDKDFICVTTTSRNKYYIYIPNSR